MRNGERRHSSNDHLGSPQAQHRSTQTVKRFSDTAIKHELVPTFEESPTGQGKAAFNADLRESIRNRMRSTVTPTRTNQRTRGDPLMSRSTHSPTPRRTHSSENLESVRSRNRHSSGSLSSSGTDARNNGSKAAASSSSKDGDRTFTKFDFKIKGSSSSQNNNSTDPHGLQGSHNSVGSRFDFGSTTDDTDLNEDWNPTQSPSWIEPEEFMKKSKKISLTELHSKFLGNDISVTETMPNTRKSTDPKKTIRRKTSLPISHMNGAQQQQQNNDNNNHHHHGNRRDGSKTPPPRRTNSLGYDFGASKEVAATDPNKNNWKNAAVGAVKNKTTRAIRRRRSSGGLSPKVVRPAEPVDKQQDFVNGLLFVAPLRADSIKTMHKSSQKQQQQQQQQQQQEGQ